MGEKIEDKSKAKLYVQKAEYLREVIRRRAEYHPAMLYLGFPKLRPTVTILSSRHNLPSYLVEYEDYQKLAKNNKLYLEFANTERTVDGVKSFADKYGSLLEPDNKQSKLEGQKSHTGINAVIDRNDQKCGEIYAESIKFWITEIEAISYTIRLYNVIHQDHDEDECLQAFALAQFILQEAEGRELTEFEEYLVDLAWNYINADDFSENVGHEICDFMHVELIQIIDGHLRKHTRPAMLETDITAELSLNIKPNSLLGVIWLQFAEEVSSRKVYKRCEAPGCNKLFAAASTGGQAGKKYCGEACRQKAHRARNEDISDLKT